MQLTAMAKKPQEKKWVDNCYRNPSGMKARLLLQHCMINLRIQSALEWWRKVDVGISGSSERLALRLVPRIILASLSWLQTPQI
jgi:hypothetical protein